MAIQYLKSDEIDKKKWDLAVAGSVKPLIYANSWYLDIVNPGWSAFIKNDYEWIFPVPAKQKLLIPYCYTPAFVQQLGFFGKSTPDITEVDTVLTKLSNKFIRINLNVQHHAMYPEKQVKLMPNSLLNLYTGYHEIYKGYHENLKRNLKKVNPNNFTIEYGKDPQDIIQLFISGQNKASKTFIKQTKELLPALCRMVNTNAELLTVGVNYEESLCCAVILFCFSGRITMIFSANSPQAKEKFAMYYLLDSLCRKFENTPNFFDFEGSTDPGTARLYNSFGAMRENYLQIKM